jgi:acetylornithine/succinyldiaminopimelate/putrescine aminotransferase
MNDRDHMLFETDTHWLRHHARAIRDRLRLLNSRPDWVTRFQPELQASKDDLTDVLEMIAEAQRDFEALPERPTELTLAGWRTLEAAE